MKRILLTINKLNRLWECETTFFDMVEYFYQLDWTVDVVAYSIEGIYENRFNAMQQSGRLNVYREEKHPVSNSYDLIWIFQGYMSETLIDALYEGKVSGVVVFQHFNYYTDKELPYGVSLENKLAWKSITTSALYYSRLALQGIYQRKLLVQSLSISDVFTEYLHKEKESDLKRILLISDRESKDIDSLQSLFQMRGIKLEQLNTDKTFRMISPEYLSGYQVVMGVSRPLIQSLALGIPVYITNTVYGGGYLNDENLILAQDRAFTSDRDVLLVEPELLVEEIISQYVDAKCWAEKYRDVVANECLLSKNLNSIISSMPEPECLAITEAERAALNLHRKVVSGNILTSRLLSNWMDLKKPSNSRMQVLEAFVKQTPSCGDIGVIIVKGEMHDEDVNLTLESLQEQYWQAKEVIVVDSHADIVNVMAETSRHYLLVINASTTLMPHSLLVFAEHSLRQPEAKLWYCDSIEGESLLTAEIHLRSDFNIDLLRSQPYIGNQILYDVAAVRDLGGLQPQLNALGGIDIAWRITENYGGEHIGHISEVLMHERKFFSEWLAESNVIDENRAVVSAHLQRLNLPGKVCSGLNERLQQVNFDFGHKPLVSVIIPTRNRLPLLKRCIESLMERTSWPHYELLIVDNNSDESDACEYLQQLESLALEQLRILRWPENFNFSAINNFAAKHAKGELLLFLNNDTCVIDPSWMTTLVEQALRPEIGIVGPRIEKSDGRLQNAGFAVSIGHGVAELGENASTEMPGFMYQFQSMRNVSAVSAVCLMIRKAVFEELNGFCTEKFPIWFGDIDLALKAKDMGYLTLWTPHARIEHMGSATLVVEQANGIAPTPNADHFSELRRKWGSKLKDDIGYNRQLAKVGSSFSLNTRMADFQQPLPGRPLPVMMGCYKNTTGCGNYRVIMPYRALSNSLSLEGGLIHGIPSVMEVAEVQPDILLLELIFDPAIENKIKQYKEISKPKIIMEYDDYVLNLPLKSAFRKNIPKGIASDLRRTVELADWLVVSTEPLAEAYANFHHDIRVANNRLDVPLWEPLKSKRRQSNKPRVGWAGGSSHTGDLEILLPFMKEMEDEVEWVFMGMQPPNVKCEFHSGVPFDHYPEKLASLNLDLALVPLENNLFNECKSNLRLLELGACGVPIICTDIEPYRCGLPVTLVSNRYKDWMNAIREHLSSWDDLAIRGDILRAAVHQKWMLRDEGLTDWQKAWLP